MFKRNEKYRQYDMFGLTDSLSKRQNKMMNNSIEHAFLENIFLQINEAEFKPLYSDVKSRPNTPVNQLVGALILKHLFNWTYSDLFKNLNFNILTRYAIGINSIEYEVFSDATIYNFQNKIIEHYVRTGTDLLTQVFDQLTASQLEEFGIKTDIQRGDSFLIGSNIFDYTRIQLLIEVLLRFYRILDKDDKKKYLQQMEDYTKQTSGQFLHKLEKEDLPKEINKLAEIYHSLFTSLENKYSDMSVFKIFKRVYFEHFEAVENKIEPIPSNNLHSEVLMSPDDSEATFRHKRNVNSKGYSGHITETSNPDNEINLITDTIVVPNNTHDAKILEKRLPMMIDKTPDLNEYHADGGYGSPNIDSIMEENSILLIQNTISGKKAFVNFVITEEIPNDYWVRCEFGQKVKAIAPSTASGTSLYKAIFDHTICIKCPMYSKCGAKKNGGKTVKPKRTWYFTVEKIRLHKRQQNKYKIPQDRWYLRSNVEATVKEVKRGIKNGKVRVRGIIQTSFYLTLTSIAVNLTRIHKYSIHNNKSPFLSSLKINFYQKLSLNMRSNNKLLTSYNEIKQLTNLQLKNAA